MAAAQQPPASPDALPSPLSSSLPSSTAAAAAVAPPASRAVEPAAHTRARSQLSSPDIPGSSPNWRACNVKSRGKAAASASPPPSTLHAVTLARWGTTPHATGSAAAASAAARRHFHHLPLAHTRAHDCLPCVDAAAKQQQQAEGPAGSGSTGSAGAQPLQQWRRHRRMVPAPAANTRTQGRRMVHGPQSGSQCKALLQDPPPLPQHTAAAAGLTDRLSLLKMDPALLAPPARARAAAAAAARQPSLSQSTPGIISSRVATAVLSVAAAPQAPPGRLAAASGPRLQPASLLAAAAAGTGLRDRDVESNPDFFRTPKDSPTLQRFIAALQPLAGGGTARHLAGLNARHAAQAAAAARDVAALPAAGGSEDD